ncbi:hypothetical protein ACTG9Q_26780 [Actinokineospora sp. 24-640]
MLTRVHALPDLAGGLCATPGLQAGWETAHAVFESWVDGRAPRAAIRRHLSELSAAEAAALVSRSRETTTHFAWCLRDEPEEPFSFWLHEYKPQRDWRAGYADSVHNHRYHFCTVILSGGYRHERFDTDIDPATGLVNEVRMTRGAHYDTGTAGYLLAEEFHRIPTAADGTMTFLVKSRPVADWSLSYDPATRVGHRHVPVECRLQELTRSI